MNAVLAPFTWLECSSCCTWLPATAEHFEPRALAGNALCCVCRACTAAVGAASAAKPAVRAKPVRETSRVCTHCGEDWPLTAEFFSRLSGYPGKYMPLCRACDADLRDARRARAAGASGPRWHVSDELAPLLTGAHFFRGGMK